MARKATLKLDAMTVSGLLKLRDKVQIALSGKIQMEREELQCKIDELSELASSRIGDLANAPQMAQAKRRTGRRGGRNGIKVNRQTHALKGRAVAPKYRDPENPDQTWAGRGLAPRWLTAYESQGRKREEYLIGAAAGPRAKGRKRR